MMKRIRKIATLGIFVVMLVFPTGTQAHDISVGGPWACGWVGISYWGYGGVGDDHTWVYVCDRSADGRGYYIEYKYEGGGSGTTGDSNGSASGCGGTDVPEVKQFKMCSKGSGLVVKIPDCTDWHGA